ncbi:hypothetical protein JCGZ_22956 [Jatropha curcas]|uniref:Uncharacterized protein n=1 Tax=Jatropha curcas TaxID=180498 RepID=A0A067L5E6_JATCU|nr:hypothetical protein JCGZ_22956 [Jatropha curcas]
MARGRAIDSNASGSVLCGGCGRGHSTRGRGGTIPPPSLGTSGASFSAQPPVPPALPSCSFLFYPTCWTSRVFTSFTVTYCTSTARERVISSQAGSEAESRMDELALYLEAIWGEKKRKVYGIGSQASQFYCGLASASNASVASSRP